MNRDLIAPIGALSLLIVGTAVPWRKLSSFLKDNVSKSTVALSLAASTMLGYQIYNLMVESHGKGKDPPTPEKKTSIDEALVRGYQDLMDHRVSYGLFEEMSLNQYRHSQIFRDLVLYFQKYIPPSTTHVGISLSGGVDSMVLLNMLLKINEYEKLGYNFKVVAFHVEHINRPEAKDEADFLRAYCQARNVIFRKYTMLFQRDAVERAHYENFSRGKRFEHYRKLMDEFQIPGFFVGQHGDDLAENVFTNIANRYSLLSLAGMNDYGVIDDVPIMRPMLHYPKKTIFEISVRANIPYFKDTTPEWSRRGKMRNEIFPVIEKEYPAFLKSLYQIGIESDGFREDLYQLLINRVLEQAITGPYGIYLDCRKLPNGLSKGLWRLILEEIFHGNGMSKMTHGVFDNFYNHINKDHLIAFSGGKGRMCYIFDRQFLFLVKQPKMNSDDVVTIEKFTTTPMTCHSITDRWTYLIKPFEELSEDEYYAKLVKNGIFSFPLMLDQTQPVKFKQIPSYRDARFPHVLTRNLPLPSQKEYDEKNLTACLVEVVWLTKI